MHCVVVGPVMYMCISCMYITESIKLTFKRLTIPGEFVWLLGKDPHIQIGISRVVTSGSQGSVMVSTLTQNARDVGSITAPDKIFHTIFVTPSMTMHFVNVSRTIQCIFRQRYIWVHMGTYGYIWG